MTRAFAKWALGMFQAGRGPQAARTSAQGKSPRTAIRGLQACGQPESPPDTVRSANHPRYPLSYTIAKTGHRLLRDWRWALALVILLAVVVRLSHLGHDSLSHDEAARVNAAWSTTPDKMRWFPPLQYALLWTVRHTLGGSEFAMRLPSALAGIACVVTLFLFTRKYVDAWSGVCVAAVAACHAELVTYSRLLKEFSIEALMTVVVTWAGVEAYRSPSPRKVWIFAACAVLGLSLTYTGSLVVLAWVPVLLWAGVTTTSERRRNLTHLGAVTLVLLLTGALWYMWLSGAFNRDGTSYHYGVLGGAWPIDYHAATLVNWFIARSYGALRYVLGISPLYAPIDTLIGAYELLLILGALGMLRKRLPSLCVAVVLLLVATATVGALRLWPYGDVHTMLFLVPFVCLAIGCGLRETIARFGKTLPAVALVIVCIANPAARAVKNTALNPSETEHVRPVLDYIDRNAQPGDGIFAYYAAGWAVQHYWIRDDVETLLEPLNDRGDITSFGTRFERFMTDHKRVWFVFTHNWKNERDEWISYLKENYGLVDEFKIADASVHLFEARLRVD